MKDRMPLAGIGAKLALFTLIYSFLLAAANRYGEFDRAIGIVPRQFLITVGALLIIAGVPWLIISIVTINAAYKKDVLCVTSVYSVCRHPLYASWIVFIIPGILLCRGSWALLTVPVVMYFIFKILIKDEESFLQNRFGKDYTAYKSRTALLFPKFWEYKK